MGAEKSGFADWNTTTFMEGYASSSVINAAASLQRNYAKSARRIMKRELIRVEPYSTNFEKWGAPVSVAARAGDTIYISGMPPFNPQTGEVENAPFEEQAERVMAQLKHALETAGSDLSHVLKCNIFCTSPDYFKPFNDVYKRYFEVGNQPARIFTIVPKWTGPFDVEIDCVAVARD
jgi:2-iminobutanoate/2-iminopropanoate deaminase